MNRHNRRFLKARPKKAAHLKPKPDYDTSSQVQAVSDKLDFFMGQINTILRTKVYSWDEVKRALQEDAKEEYMTNDKTKYISW